MAPHPQIEVDHRADAFLGSVIEAGWSTMIEELAPLPWLAGLTLIDSSSAIVRRYGFILALTAVSQTPATGTLATTARDLRTTLITHDSVGTSLRYLELSA